jgi:hypothetical protein
MAKTDVYGDKFTTPVGRLSYPSVFEKAKSLEEGKEGKYEATLYISKSIDISAIRKLVEEIGKKAFGDEYLTKSKFKKPILDGDELDDVNGKGHWVIRTRTGKRPVVCDKNRQEILDKEEIYGGVWARLNVTPGSYDLPTSKGVTFYLNAVQKVKDDEPFGGGRVTAEDAFADMAIEEPQGVEENF